MESWNDGISVWQWIGTIIVLTILIVMGYFIFNRDYVVKHETEQEYCEWYGDISAKNVPIKCLKYFGFGSVGDLNLLK